MHHPTDRVAHTTAFITPVVEHWLEREIAPTTHRTMSERSYHGATSRSGTQRKGIALFSEGLNRFAITVIRHETYVIIKR